MEPVSKAAIPVITILICACLCVFFLNTGILSLFYLAPLGYAVLVSGTVLPVFASVAVINALFSIVLNMVHQNVPVGMLTEILYFTVLFLCFSWVIDNVKYFQIRAVYRFMLAAVTGSLAFLGFIVGDSSNSGFNIMLMGMAEYSTSVIFSAVEYDPVRHSALLQILSPEKVVEVTRSVLFRGGALVGVIFLFFINRQISFIALSLIKKQRRTSGFVAFFAPPQTIWVLSCSLALILLTNLFRVEIIEVMAWNVFVVCVIIFLAQGAGILVYLLSQRSPVFRVAGNVLIIIMIFTPGINTLALAASIILGIIECWRPIRRIAVAAEK